MIAVDVDDRAVAADIPGAFHRKAARAKKVNPSYPIASQFHSRQAKAGALAVDGHGAIAAFGSVDGEGPVKGSARSAEILTKVQVVAVVAGVAREFNPVDLAIAGEEHPSRQGHVLAIESGEHDAEGVAFGNPTSFAPNVASGPDVDGRAAAAFKVKADFIHPESVSTHGEGARSPFGAAILAHIGLGRKGKGGDISS